MLQSVFPTAWLRTSSVIPALRPGRFYSRLRTYMKKGNLKKVVIYLIVIAWYSIVLLGAQTSNNLRQEDHLIENLGAIYFLITSILFFASYLRSSGLDDDENHIHSKRKYFYLFLAVIFFIGFGEEISWGQRLMGWESPQFLQEINEQKEINFHNLKILDKGILRTDVWFFIFWFSYCLILPIVNKCSLGSRKYISRFGIPLPPLWIGFLLLTNFIIYVIPKFFVSKWPEIQYIDSAFLEIMESNCAFIFAVLAFHDLRKLSLIKKER